MGVRSGKHVVFNLKAHIVFVTKYRRRVFSEPDIAALKNIFRVVCADFETELVEVNGESDHVHLLISYPPKFSISAIVNSLKGVSSRRLKADRPAIRRHMWFGKLWSPSYFVSSAGGAPLEVLKKYIQNQGAENGTLLPGLKSGVSARG